MSGFLSSSIGKKFLMSITGIFLILFLVMHLSINLTLFFGEETFNEAAHFMGTNPVIRIIEPLLAVGFVLHIFYAGYITLLNRNKRPIGFSKADRLKTSSWASQNMFILGGIIFVFLVLHLLHFFYYMKITGMPETIPALDGGTCPGEVTYNGETIQNAYCLVTSLFGIWYYVALYVVGAILLGLHISHGFWSAFQTLGWSNDMWRKRLNVVSIILALVFAFGFSVIPLYFLIMAI